MQTRACGSHCERKGKPESALLLVALVSDRQKICFCLHVMG